MLWFHKKKKELSTEMAQEMQRQSLETRRLQQQINQLSKRAEMKQELTALSNYVTGEDKESNQMMTLLAPLLLNMVAGGNNTNTPQISNNGFLGAKTATNIDFEKNNRIVTLLADKVPKQYISQLQTLTDDDIIYIKNKLIEVNLG